MYLYIITGVLLLLSFAYDRKKTIKSLKKAYKSLMNILPKLIGIVVMIGIMLAIFDEEVISSIIGAESGFIGVVTAAIIGSITLIPGFIAFPTAKLLLENGAGVMQIAAFISSLMMVGVMTIPMEIEYFGKKVTFLRNIMTFIFSFLVAVFVSQVVSGTWF